MSAYIAYKATVGMPESRRTVVSNIHREGTIPAEAGAHIADIIKTILIKSERDRSEDLRKEECRMKGDSLKSKGTRGEGDPQCESGTCKTAVSYGGTEVCGAADKRL